MGFLEIGQPLNWEDTKPLVSRVKSDGIKQLLHIWSLNRYREDHDLKWGDEMEYNLLHFDHQQKKARLYVGAPAILEDLHNKEADSSWENAEALGKTATILSGARSAFLRGAEWHPEFGNHMIESTPNPPYELSVDSLLDVEDSLLSRRYKLQSVLPEDVYIASMAAFPLLGCEDFYTMPDNINKEEHEPGDQKDLASTALFPHALINPHPRFGTLVRNINARRGTKINALMPVHRDHHTSESAAWEHSGLAEKMTRQEMSERSKLTNNPALGQIYMDHFGHGMSMCCLQITFGTPNIETARFLYDQMAVLAPIFLSLSAATPMLRGWLAGTDARWRVLEQTSDCRTEEELETLKRSRYGAVSSYLSTDDYLVRHATELNDVEVPIDMNAYYQLREAEMDRSLAKHFASLWVRDPVVVFHDRLDLDNTTHMDHFENIQSTNWNSVRFKPPPVSHDGVTASKIGWRVELRTPDIQLSDFENAALSSFASLLGMAIMKHRWNFYMPISKTHQNMETAHMISSISKHRFWFRNDVGTSSSETDAKPVSESLSQMTMREIFLGCHRTGFLGLIPLLDGFVSDEWRHHRCGRDAVEKYRLYANYIRQKVTGQAWSDAKLLRHLVETHPQYQGTSEVSHVINYDVCKFAVLGGFSLCPEVSPWGLPGCMPSSIRLPRMTSLSSLATLPLLNALAQLPAAGDKDKAAAILRERTSHECEDNWDDDIDTLSACGSKSVSVPALGSTPSRLTANDFDAKLFLEMDQHSR